MTQFSTGSYIRKDDQRRKILGEAGEMRFLSRREGTGDWETTVEDLGYCATLHVQELIRGGWVEEKQEWEPEKGDLFWYFTPSGLVASDVWSGILLDMVMLAFRNVFPTQEACEAAIKERKEGKK